MKKRCQSEEHDYQYQLMEEVIDTGMHSWRETERILFCRKCGDIKKIKLSREK